MITLFHRQILRLLPGPFLGWLGTITFLLLMQFLIRFLPDIVGKGLSPQLIVELIAYNLANMVVLAVPMSVLIASLMAFGKLSETNAYLVMKSAGVSLPRLLWPTVLLTLALSGGMWYFNNEILPEANYRARNLWMDIRRKKPGFQLEPGVFYRGLSGYSILIRRIPALSNELQDILIYDYTGVTEQPVTIKAARGRLDPAPDGRRLTLVLYNGEVHFQVGANTAETEKRYERLGFGTYRLQLDLADFQFERTSPEQGYRSDRTMRTADMVGIVDSLQQSAAHIRANLAGLLRADPLPGDALWIKQTLEGAPPSAGERLPAAEAPPPRVAHPALAGLDSVQAAETVARAVQRVEVTRSQAAEMRLTLEWEAQRMNRYQVEIHKKTSIALACVIYMLIGAPLGLFMRRGGLARSGAIAMAIFLFYWITLVQGEKAADRGLLAPWLGMWVANIAASAAAVWLFAYHLFDLGATPRLRQRLPFFGRPAPKLPAA